MVYVHFATNKSKGQNGKHFNIFNNGKRNKQCQQKALTFTTDLLRLFKSVAYAHKGESIVAAWLRARVAKWVNTEMCMKGNENH